MTTQNKRIQLIFPECDVEMTATLFEDRAPVSSQALWDILETPLETTVKNTWPELAEIYFLTPNIEDLPFENQVIFATAGDLLFFHYVKPNGRKVCDVAIYYTKGYTEIETGWMPGNGVGKIDENLEGLRKVIAHAMLETYQKIIVKRVE